MFLQDFTKDSDSRMRFVESIVDNDRLPRSAAESEDDALDVYSDP